MRNRAAKESGVALVMVLLLMLIFTVMMLGFYFVTTGEQKIAASDRDNTATYYAAVGGLEKMSSDVAAFFVSHTSPTPTQINALTGSTYQPTIPGVTFPAGGYTITNLPTTTPPCTPNPTTLCSSPGTIGGNGPLQGLQGIITDFMLTVIADGPNNTEVKMARKVQEVAVPVFQFGIFSQTDLSFFAGPDFGFGGRIHTNGNLFLAEDGGTLTAGDRTTAFKDVIRAQLSNGYTITSGGSYSTTVNVLSTAGGCPGSSPACRALALTEGSVTGGPGSAVNSAWNTLSLTTYNGWIRNGKTGAKSLNLALALAGASPIAMIQLPMTNPPGPYEDPTGTIGHDRFFNQASLRILLSDQASSIMDLPGIDSSVQPFPLDESLIHGAPYNLPAADSLHPPLAQSVGYSVDPDYMSPSGTTLLGGYIKIEEQQADGNFHDVTREILSLGISGDVLTMSAEPALVSGGTLGASITYYYVVTALGPWGESLGMEYGPYTTTSANKKITITWNVMTGATGYRVYRGSALGQETQFYAVTSGSTTSYSETGTTTGFTAGSPPTNTSILHLEEASPGMAPPTFSTSGSSGLSSPEYYVVTALGSWGESGGAEAPVPTFSGSKKITVNWTSYPGATGYRIYRGATAGGETGYISAGTCTTCSYQDSGATLTTYVPPTGVQLNSVVAATYAPNFYPVNMYDPREGEVRDPSSNTNGPTTLSLNGIMNLMEVDVRNLQQWLAGNLVPPVSSCTGPPVSCGPLVWNSSPHILYVSDRRGNVATSAYCSSAPSGAPWCDVNNTTGEFGNEDIINPSVAAGTPNGSLDSYVVTGITYTPEDVNGNGLLDTYGATPHPIAVATGSTWQTKLATMPATNPAFVRITASQAQKNSVVVFRRAVRLVNGRLGNLPPLNAATAAGCPGALGGFTLAAENPVYILGDYNATNTLPSTASPAGFNDITSGAGSPLCHVPAAVIADTVTLLSNDWTDSVTFTNPAALGSRPQTTHDAWYRTAIIGGKNLSFPKSGISGWPSIPNDAGTDGGTHNFLRYIESWNTTLNYLGAMASFYISRQATGIYKCCNAVYDPPTRAYAFDTDFTNISKLPPGTPRFTDVNALSYQQGILASQ